MHKLLQILILSCLVSFTSNYFAYTEETKSHYEDNNIYFEIISKENQNSYASGVNQSLDTLIYVDFPLDLLITVLTETDKKNIKLQTDNYQFAFFDVKVLIKNKNDDIINMLKNAFESTLNLTIVQQTAFSHFYQLQITDSAKLNKYLINRKPEAMQIRSSCLNINYMNANLSAIADNLSAKTGEYIEYTGDNKNHYSFEVRNFDLDKLALELSEHIGLNLSKSHKLISFVIISPK